MCRNKNVTTVLGVALLSFRIKLVTEICHIIIRRKDVLFLQISTWSLRSMYKITSFDGCSINFLGTKCSVALYILYNQWMLIL